MIAAVGIFFLAIFAGIVVLSTVIFLLARRKKRD
jgi:LPXTG-motif cell wall-anchored protein